MNILVTGVGGPTPRSFALSLKLYSNYDTYNFIGTDINPLSYGLYQKDLFSHGYVVPKAGTEEYWKTIEDIIHYHQIKYAVILPEMEVLEWSRKASSSFLPCQAFIPDLQLGEVLVDKARMTDILDPLGIVPPSLEFNREESNLLRIFDRLGSDFWVRSSSGTSGLGSLRIDSLDSLKNWIQINPKVNTFLASQYLPGRNLACKLLYDKGQLIRSACGERVNYIMSKVSPSGITGNTSFGRLLNAPEIIKVAKRAMDYLFIATQASKQGFFTVDLKEDGQGNPFITEINIRHVAFTQCFAAGGANFAEDTIRIMDNDILFDRNYQMYEFQEGLIFLRDVDGIPILMNEENQLTPLMHQKIFSIT